MGQNLTITFVARRAGIRASAIRYYESIGLLPAPTRVSGRRCYDSAILSRLALIAAVRDMGFTIKEIGTLMHGFAADVPASARWQVLAAEKLKEVEALIERAEGMRQLLGEALRCGCLSLDSCARAFQTKTKEAS